ncbi:hypothetical protein [Streptomyces sp. NBC_01362]|uniref:hypothetical protein n=1 Tax=Streptomyces sp. NBC_01362 TaxID=2903839 RepID=UPI003FCD15D6
MHIVRDDTAMTTAYQGNVLASSLIRRAHAEPGWFLYAPACALVGGDRARPRTAEHLTAPPGIAKARELLTDTVATGEGDVPGCSGVAGLPVPHAASDRRRLMEGAQFGGATLCRVGSSFSRSRCR